MSGGTGRPARSGLVVGFDLDMTLVDSRPGIAATYAALSGRTGVPIDTELATSRLGPPLAEEVAAWFLPGEVPAAVALFRELYPSHAVTGTTALPGAHEALAAVHAAGGRTVVVTSKLGSNAALHVAHLGLAVDDLVGDLYAAAKGAALAARSVVVYVGDHTADVLAARAGSAVAVAVATGPFGAGDLRAAGADAVLDDLTAFPAWFARHLAQGRDSTGPGPRR